MTIIDADSHLYETRDLWVDHSSSRDRARALRIVDDELGYAWLQLGSTPIEVLGIHEPGDVAQSGRFRERLRRELPPEASYDAMPADFWDPAARLEKLDTFGIDETIAFPNCGIMWELALAGDLEATIVNMAAWNRYAAEVASEGRGRLHPVGHVTLRDPRWLEQELDRLAAAGIRVAMLAPALADGRRLSHPDHERAWAAFADHGIAVVFHIGQYPLPFDPAWNEGDPDWSNPVLSSVFMWNAPAIALADLAVRGVLARHPRLRLGVVELMAAWLPMFSVMLDGGFSFHARFNGEPLTALEHPPSHYVRAQVRVAAFGFEQPRRLADQVGDVFMFGSDYPHPEGLSQPLEEYVAATQTSPADADGLYHANAAWLLGQDQR